MTGAWLLTVALAADAGAGAVATPTPVPRELATLVFPTIDVVLLGSDPGRMEWLRVRDRSVFPALEDSFESPFLAGRSYVPEDLEEALASGAPRLLETLRRAFSLLHALGASYEDNLGFPSPEAYAMLASGTPAPGGLVAALDAPPHLEDSWGSAFHYRPMGAGKRRRGNLGTMNEVYPGYELTLVGPDGKRGTTDDIVIRSDD